MDKKVSLSTIITYVFCAVAVAIALFTAYTLITKDNSEQEKKTNTFFGYNFFVVLSGSMEKEFPVGSLIVSKEVDCETIEVGDIISFVSIDTNYFDEVVSHKIRSITEYEGELAFETYGTTTGVSDGYPALASKVLGKYQYTIPYVGNAIVFIQGENGFMLFIIIPLAIIFILQVVKLVKRLKDSDDDEEEEVPAPKKEEKPVRVITKPERMKEKTKEKYVAKRYRT